MLIKEYIKNTQNNISNKILNYPVNFGEIEKIEEYGKGKFDLFDGIKLVFSEYEVIINLEDNEFAELIITHYTEDDGFTETGYDADLNQLYVNRDGNVL